MDVDNEITIFWDNAKKKVIKTTPSYDEFHVMVNQEFIATAKDILYNMWYELSKKIESESL